MTVAAVRAGACMRVEEEDINSECGGFPDLPIIGAEGKRRPAARGCRGDTNRWNDVEMGVIIAHGRPERERQIGTVNICK